MGPKTILVVDDQPALANTLRVILDRAGYNAIAVYSAAGAIEVLRASRIDLLISDVVMPEMNGMELAVHTRENYPATNILLISGNAATQEIVINSALGHEFELLSKPVLPKHILARIHSLLSPSD